MFAANGESKKDDITINYCKLESGWLHGILIAVAGGADSAVCPNTLSGNDNWGKREPKIAITTMQYCDDTSYNETMQKFGSKITC